MIRKYGLWVLIAFVAFYLFTRPADAAAAVNGAFDTITNGADRLAIFVTNVVAR